MENRVDETTSMTAAMTCSIRAASFYEKDQCLKSDDFIAPLLLPRIMQPVVKSGLIRRLFMKFMAPKGIYEYVIALVLRIKKHDPELYKERTVRQKEGKRWDKILLSFTLFSCC
jgi:hypothetical protein